MSRGQDLGSAIVKILLVSFHFPPQAPIAATRAPRLASHLIHAGHDVRVLCADDPQPVAAHLLPVDPHRVIRTPWIDRRALPGRTARVPSKEPAHAIAAPRRPSPLRTMMRKSYETLCVWPDGRIGWRGPAMHAAEALLAEWVPDLVYVTAPPHSSVVIARAIARKAGARFFAEFRDRWGDDAYSDHPPWRRAIERRWETRCLADAERIITVSPLWARDYARRFGDDKLLVMRNGFDPADYPVEAPVPPDSSPVLQVLYSGSIYVGRRDPGPVIDALALLGKRAAQIRLTMIGAHLETAAEQAALRGVVSSVEILPPEAHASIVRRQYAADVNLLLQWNDERDAGTLPGKFFEYIAARRPILATGWPDGAAARIMRSRQLGLFSNKPSAIAEWLQDLLALKTERGVIEPLPVQVREGYSRAEQFDLLLPHLDAGPRAVAK